MWLPTSAAADYTRVDLSPRGNYLAIGPAGAATGGSVVVRLPSGAPVATFAPDSSGWLDFLFTPGEEKVYSLGKRSADYSIDAVTFASPGKVTSRIVPAYTTLLGFSDGCPVLYAACARRVAVVRRLRRRAGRRRPARSGPVRSRQRGAVERRDVPRRRGAKPGGGRHLVAPAARPGAAADHRPARRRGGWQPLEFPVAITRGAGRILTGARSSGAASAARGTRSTSATAAGMLIDTLPPGVPAVDAAVGTIAYGPQLWCAR